MVADSRGIYLIKSEALMNNSWCHIRIHGTLLAHCTASTPTQAGKTGKLQPACEDGMRPG